MQLVPRRSIMVSALAACLGCACSAPHEASTVVRSLPEVASDPGGIEVTSPRAAPPAASGEPPTAAAPAERLRHAASSMFLEVPFSGGVVGGLGGAVLSNGVARVSGDALRLNLMGAVGPRVGLAFNYGYLFTAASYDYSLLLEQGAWHHASATLGACVPDAPMMTPFLGLSLRVWDLEIGPRAGETLSWSSGVRASAALDGGVRITPWLWPGTSRKSPVLIGPVLRGSGPIAGGGGWTATAGLTFGGGLD
jgi:hypothetical protein